MEDGWGRSGGFKPRCFFVDCQKCIKVYHVYYVIQFAACFSDIILEVVSR